MTAKIRVLLLGYLALGLGAPVILGTQEGEMDRLMKTYSTQRIVVLNAGQELTFKLKNGGTRVIRLVSFRESRDSVIGLIRRADIRVEIDGRPADLVCAPYVLPSEIDGLRLQADTTSGWTKMPGQVQFSIWDASDPVVDTERFGFPLRAFRLFSHGTQAYGEPVHLGAGDGDPDGQRFYHDYGFDMAGYEGRDEVVCAAAGAVVAISPSRENPSSVIIRDDAGMLWEYGHLSMVAPDIVPNSAVAKGRKIGILGKTGPSGNFSHIHLGCYLSLRDMENDRPNRRLNLYPWLVAAYQAIHPKGLFAVARPHHEVLTGEKIVLDGSNSLVWGGSRIVEWRWVLPDGKTVNGARAETSIAAPGAYTAALWIKDDRGAEDVDFCQIKVYTRDHPEKGMPHIFMTVSPTQDIKPGQAVIFRFWFQGEGGSPMTVDFGDGTKLIGRESYAEIRHAFKTPGIHIVEAGGNAGGRPVSQKLKVVVTAEPTR